MSEAKKSVFASTALTEKGWERDVLVQIGASGR